MQSPSRTFRKKNYIPFYKEKIHMKRSLFLAASLCAALLTFTSCSDDKSSPTNSVSDSYYQGGYTEYGDYGDAGNYGSGNNGGYNGNTQSGTAVSVPDCFVYFPGAKFTYKRTLDDGRVSKITWEVTDFDASTYTATILEKFGDNEPSTKRIRKGNNGVIEFESSGSWKAVTDGGTEINFMMGSKLNSIPSGCYGSVKNSTKLTSATLPGGTTSQGFSIGSEYTSTTGYHDSFMFDYSSGETWSTEAGLTRASYAYRNGKEYPIFVNTTDIELVAYDIPMPDGTRRTYQPAGSTIYDVEDTHVSYTQFPANTQRYAAMFFYWNDPKNTNVMRYTLYAVWFNEGTSSWNYSQITSDMNTWWTFYGWFAGTPYSGNVIGGPKAGLQYQCEGMYSSSERSQSYTPFGTALSPNYGWFIFFIMAENSVATGEIDMEKTEFVAIEIPDPNEVYAASTYSTRVTLFDDGTFDVYDESAASTYAPPIRPSVPDKKWITGPIRRLK